MIFKRGFSLLIVLCAIGITPTMISAEEVDIDKIMRDLDSPKGQYKSCIDMSNGVEEGKYDSRSAIWVCNQFVDSFPNHKLLAKVHLELGILYHNNKDYELAIKELTKSLNLETDPKTKGYIYARRSQAYGFIATKDDDVHFSETKEWVKSCKDVKKSISLGMTFWEKDSLTIRGCEPFW